MSKHKQNVLAAASILLAAAVGLPPIPEARAQAQTVRDCAECPEMVSISAGKFMMGSPKTEYRRSNYYEDPRREVRVAAFALGKYEVTFAQWDVCVAAGGCKHRPNDKGWGRADRPVIDVSWHDVQEYLAWLSKRAGKQYRLPSEAEWEYAARAGTTTRFFWGDDIGKGRANCDGCGTIWDNLQTAPVGRFPANPWGLHDMHGNVYEWVADCWHENYENAPVDGSARTSGDCSLRPVRGGSYSMQETRQRSAARIFDKAGDRMDSVGFRVARVP